MNRTTNFLVLLAGATAGTLATGAARSRNGSVVQDAFRRWGAGEGSILDLMDDDGEVVIPGTAPHCGTFRKSAFVRDVATPFLARFSRPPAPRVRQLWAEDDDVAVLADADGTTRDGRPYANRYVFVLQLHRGRITRATEFLDMAAFNDVWDTVEPSPVPDVHP